MIEISHVPAGEIADSVLDPVEDVVEHGLIGVEELLAFGGDVIDLFPVLVGRLDVPLIFEQLKGGIDGPGGRGVAAAEPPSRSSRALMTS